MQLRVARCYREHHARWGPMIEARLRETSELEANTVFEWLQASIRGSTKAGSCARCNVT